MRNVIIKCDPRYRVNKATIQQVVISILDANKVRGNVEVEVTIVGDRKMHELNRNYRGIDSSTDILTFALEEMGSGVGFVSYPDKVLRLGSIVISYNQALEDAALDGKTLESELVFLAEHGTKHLLGIHHI